MVAATASAATNQLRAEDREAIIREAYRDLADLVARGGATIGFRIAVADTLQPSSFDKVRWVDVATLPGGNMIDMVPQRLFRQGAPAATTYKPRWQLHAAKYLDSDEGREVATKSIAEVLARAERESADMRNVIAITTYHVTVAFAGRSRAYDAAVLWFPGNDRHRSPLFFADHITQGVGEAIHERQVTATREPRRPGEKTLGTCEEWSQTEAQSWAGEEGLDQHLSGSHHTSATAYWTCSCDASCTSRVSGQLLTDDCSDDGVIWAPMGGLAMCHQMQAASAFAMETKFNATDSGASAQGGYTCGMKTCFGCLCGITISVGLSGGGTSGSIVWNPTNADWHPQQPFGVSCAPCVKTSPNGGGGDHEPFNDDPPPPGGWSGGGSGSGGGGCCQWQTSCYVDAHGIYTCTPTNTCAVWGC